jgi:hypothetical protein
MTAVVGVKDLCPPLCSFSQLKDGSISLLDIEMYHWAIDELTAAAKSSGK